MEAKPRVAENKSTTKLGFKFLKQPIGKMSESFFTFEQLIKCSLLKNKIIYFYCPIAV